MINFSKILSLCIVLTLTSFSFINAQALSPIYLSKENISDFCFSTDGSTIYFPENMLLKSVKTDSIKKITDIHQVHSGKITAVAISNNDSIIVSGGKDSCIIVYHLKDKFVLNKYKHESWVSCVSISTDNRYVFSGDASGNVKIFDLKENKIIKAFQPHSKAVTAVITDNYLSYLITASFDGFVYLYDFKNANISSQKVIYKSRKPIHSIDLTFDNSRLIISSDNGKISVWEINYPLFYKISLINLIKIKPVSVDWYESGTDFAYGTKNGKLVFYSFSGINYKYKSKKIINKVALQPRIDANLIMAVSFYFDGIYLIHARDMYY